MRPWPVWPDGFASSREDRRALLVLSALRGTTPRGMIELAIRTGSAAASLAEIREGRAGSPNDQAFARALDADAIAAARDASGARFVTWGSAEYPSQLEHVHDPPAALYVIGRRPPDVTTSVAIVGARRCTTLGRETSHAIGRALGLAGVTVVSGAARGIDAAAHEGCLSADGPTLAVLGSGLDVAYPSASRGVLARIRAVGTLVSEYAPGTPPSQRTFPARNRIVAGMCAATVVVEGAAGSGSMITAEHAMEFGRDVFAVPGPVTGSLSCVPLQLIRDGATMIRGPEDLLADLGFELVQEEITERVDLGEDERRVLDRIVEPTLPDRLASALGTGVPEVVGVLMRLELRGFVRNVGGRYESTLKARGTQPDRASRRSARGTPLREMSRTGTPARSRRLAAIEDR
jgi:DNA processing protein